MFVTTMTCDGYLLTALSRVVFLFVTLSRVSQPSRSIGAIAIVIVIPE